MAIALTLLGGLLFLSNTKNVRTKQSTTAKLVGNMYNAKTGPKHELFNTVRDVGGIVEAGGTSALPRNTHQAYYEKQKLTGGSYSGTKKPKDVLASVLELQKGSCRGFIRDVDCNDLPTI